MLPVGNRNPGLRSERSQTPVSRLSVTASRTRHGRDEDTAVREAKPVQEFRSVWALVTVMIVPCGNPQETGDGMQKKMSVPASSSSDCNTGRLVGDRLKNSAARHSRKVFTTSAPGRHLVLHPRSLMKSVLSAWKSPLYDSQEYFRA